MWFVKNKRYKYKNLYSNKKKERDDYISYKPIIFSLFLLHSEAKVVCVCVVCVSCSWPWLYVVGLGNKSFLVYVYLKVGWILRSL